MLINKFGIITIFLFLYGAAIYAQENVLTLLPWNGDTTTYVEAQIIADTIANGGLLPNRVYELQRDQIYFHHAILNIRSGLTLRLRAASGTGKRPIIYLDEVPGTGRPPGNMVVLNGGNLEMKGICVAGYYEGEPDRLGGIQGGLIQVGGIGSYIVLDSVILSNVNGNLVRANASTKKIHVTNTIFANMGALTRSNLGAGKGFDLRETSHDTLILTNNTFVNFQDRAIRHIDLGDTALGRINYLLINHNTFVNGMSFHGLLSLGIVGAQATINNNLFVDAFALGEDSTDAIRSSEWLHTGETYGNGNNRMTWVIVVPNNTTQWTISNNYYTVSTEGQAWLNDNHFGHGPFGIGSPLSYHVNSRLGADSINAFISEDGLTLNNVPKLMTNMMTWYEDPAGANRTKETGTFVVAQHDYDRRVIQYYRDTLDAAYPTSSAAYTGSTEGGPVGDLNWFPEFLDVEEYNPNPTTFTLNQNYPNPFNPSTRISFFLEKSGLTTLSIYNVLGQKIATLLSEDLSNGKHTIDFNGVNLSSGVYFYKIESGDFSAVKKMMFLK